MDDRDRQRWIEHLRHVSGTPDIRAPLGLGSLEGPVRAAPAGGAHVAPSGAGSAAPEVRLWRAACETGIDAGSIVDIGADGPLLDVGAFMAIEVWTDAELSAVHALWRLARTRGQPSWRHRVERARDWHVEHTQPDNATNRPWALHVFLLAGRPETRHYAETLLHNALALEATPTPLAALLLRDAADELGK